jgi:alpha-amylase
LNFPESKSFETPQICYEIFVRSFCDSNKDGIGDLNGITSKLEYLSDLGIDTIWLSPICKSPSYHKYDVTDYKSIDPEFGSIEDFKNLIEEAHKREIKVLFDFVINHTSNKHHWFEEAKKDINSKYRNYYQWMSPEKIEALGIAVREKTSDSMETQPWHWANKGDTEKYYGLFWSGMPDLNMDSTELREEIYEIGKFWLEMGIDGFRMDAAKHIYPSWESEKCHDFWVEFRQKMEAINPNVYIVGEVWTSAEKIAPFFRGLKANFNFDLSQGIQEIIKTSKDSNGIINKLIESYVLYAKENPDFIDATMLSNHDQERIGSVANGNLEKLKMAANLLLTLPGNPYLYYGEELGMLGKKPDEKIREAFLWNYRFEDKDRTNWQKPKYNTDSKVKPLKSQQSDPNSLYNHYKTLIALRKKHDALGQVSPPNLGISNIKVEGILSFIRPHESGNILVIQNITNSSIEINYKISGQEILYKSENVLIRESKITLSNFGLLVIKEALNI